MRCAIPRSPDYHPAARSAVGTLLGAQASFHRFLWLLVRRSKLLPDGPSVPDAELAPLVDELRDVVRFAGTFGELARDAAATASWRASTAR